MNVIARCAKRAVAIKLDCFLSPAGRTRRNDRIPKQLLELVQKTCSRFRVAAGVSACRVRP